MLHTVDKQLELETLCQKIEKKKKTRKSGSYALQHNSFLSDHAESVR